MTDRWIECDLLWFKPDDIQGRVDAYFDRIGPLYASAPGEKGVFLNMGWRIDPAICWTGNLDDRLAIVRYGNKRPACNYPALDRTNSRH